MVELWKPGIWFLADDSEDYTVIFSGSLEDGYMRRMAGRIWLDCGVLEDGCEEDG